MKHFFWIVCFMISFNLQASDYVEVTDFGDNPGRLGMLKYIPGATLPNAPMVILLHGCNQTPEEYVEKSGWKKYAEREGFYLLMPVQNSGNNYFECFNWFEKEDITRGRGEASSIAFMIKKMLKSHSIDNKKVFITGLSAGGAMSAVMMAIYPELINAGASVAGVPFGCADNASEGFMCMYGLKNKTPKEWAEKVKNALPGYSGTYPRLSIWQGTNDPHVKAMNAEELVEQWAAVHKINAEPTELIQVSGHDRYVYKKNGRVIIEKFIIQDQGHGQPVDPGNSVEQCGSEGKWIVDSGICASYHIARFWGLVK